MPQVTITGEGLRSRAAQPPTEAASDPPVALSGPDSGVVSPAALLRHLKSAEDYLSRCERDLAQARQCWLSASQGNDSRIAEEARRALEAATGQLERARAYREEAQTAARRAGVQPVTH
jgi:hypothetical protein